MQRTSIRAYCIALTKHGSSESTAIGQLLTDALDSQKSRSLQETRAFVSSILSELRETVDRVERDLSLDAP